MPDFDLDALRARQAAARAEAAAAHTSDDQPPHLDPAAIAACPLCDGDGYRGTTVCDHTDHAEAARRGMCQLRTRMGWPHNRDETRDEMAQPNQPHHPHTENRATGQPGPKGATA